MVALSISQRRDTTTGDDGAWTPCVPKDADVAFVFEKPGYLASIFAIHTTAEPPNRGRWIQIGMFPDAGEAATWGSYGIAYPPTTQALVWMQTYVHDLSTFYYPSGIGDVSVVFTPADGAQGPYYSDASDNPDPNAIATNASSPNIYAALTPAGDETVTLAHRTLATCTHFDTGWSAGANVLRLPIRAGYRTYMAATCY